MIDNKIRSIALYAIACTDLNKGLISYANQRKNIMQDPILAVLRVVPLFKEVDIFDRLSLVEPSEEISQDILMKIVDELVVVGSFPLALEYQPKQFSDHKHER